MGAIEPDISVIMPVYNGEKYIKDSIQSILDQTYSNFELIIIDDGSTDKTKSIIYQFNDKRIIYLSQSNSGPAVARNTGINISMGNYIAILDADDIALPDRLLFQKQFLDENKDYALVGCNAYIIDMNGTEIYITSALEKWEDIKRKAPESSFIHSSIMFRREHFFNLGGYKSLYSMEDSYFIFEMMALGKMTNLSVPLIKYRLLPNSVTSKSGKNARLLKKIYNELAIDGHLSENNRIILDKLKKENNPKDKLSLYHLHLSKKYIWNNYKPGLSRYNSILALKHNLFNSNAFVYLFISLIPNFLLKKIYSLKG